MTDRRQQRDEMQSTWVVYEPAEAKAAFFKSDFEDAADREAAPAAPEGTPVRLSRHERRAQDVARRRLAAADRGDRARAMARVFMEPRRP